MLGGYVDKILSVDLTNKEIFKSKLEDRMALDFISGRGLGDKIIYDNLAAGTDPLSPENVIVLTTGLLTGTNSPFSSRSYLVTKSPLTGAILMGNSGGYLGPELKFAGYDALVLKGKAEVPSYLWINDGEIEIRSAQRLWRSGTKTTQKVIGEETDEQAKIACIGPAAEKLVKFACVRCGDRAFGRGGTGAVFGSKNLKAIAVSGHGKVDVADKDAFESTVAQVLDTYRQHAFIQEWRKFGTPYIVGPMNELGLFPTRNFQTGLFEEYHKIDGNAHKKHVVKHITCYKCPVACNSWSVVQEGEYAGSECRGPEYETLWSFGGACGNSNLEAIIAANSMCNELGMDTESTGSSIAFAMELFENGILTERDTAGLKLTFGNHKAMVQLVKMIGNREGFGDILAEGVKKASQKIGKGAEKYAMHVKGLEIDGYDPRGAKAQALSYATASRGGCHHSGYAKQELYDSTFDRFTEQGKGKLTKQNEDETALVDSTGLCAFPHQLGVISNDQIASLLVAASGIKEFRDVTYLLRVGERIINLERLFNLREGFTTKDDVLPQRFLKEPMPTGNSKGQVVDFKPMLEEYYTARGWSKKGVPRKNKLRKLGLL
jgi:aldehyde:ferredoxin oxidoreductase